MPLPWRSNPRDGRQATTSRQVARHTRGLARHGWGLAPAVASLTPALPVAGDARTYGSSASAATPEGSNPASKQLPLRSLGSSRCAGVRPVYVGERWFEPARRPAPVPPVATRWPCGRDAGSRVLAGDPPGPSLGSCLAAYLVDVHAPPCGALLRRPTPVLTPRLRQAPLSGPGSAGQEGSALRTTVRPSSARMLGRQRRGRARERIGAATELREGDDLAQVVGVAELHRDAIDAGRDASVRRRAEAQRAQQEAEALLGLRRARCRSRRARASAARRG